MAIIGNIYIPNNFNTRFSSFLSLLKRLFLVGLFCTFYNFGAAQNGKALFRNKCMICHGVTKAIAAPPLKGVEERIPDKKLLYDWIRNNKKILASGDAYFNDLYIKWNKAPMNLFEDLSDADIDAILLYVKEAARKEEAAAEIQTVASEDSGGKYLLLIAGIAVLIGIWWLLKKKAKKIE